MATSGLPRREATGDRPRRQVVAGGRLVRQPGGGQFYAPTVLAGVTPAMRIWREEVFGPVRGPPRTPGRALALQTLR